MAPSSSIQTPVGTLTTPRSRSSECSWSISAGWVGWAASRKGRAASHPPVSMATVTISSPSLWRASRLSCHTGRSNRQPHQDAQASNRTLVPRRDSREKSPPRHSGRVIEGRVADESARPPAWGPRAHRPWAESSITAMPRAPATGRTSKAHPSRRRARGHKDLRGMRPEA